tara:strand:+ start:1504 stop:2091 length:588 start_codon:yes stop_codon:yes gene_type:complete
MVTQKSEINNMNSKDKNEMETDTVTKVEDAKGTKSNKATDRSVDMRESTQRTYLDNESFIAIPPEVELSYKDQGYRLGWLRIYLQGQEDYKAVSQKLNAGWEFVTSDEVPQMTGGMGYNKTTDRFQECIVRGDVALAKIPEDIFQQRKEVGMKRNRDMNDAINTRLQSMNDRRMPITNSSSSNTTVGGRPTKFDQ